MSLPHISLFWRRHAKYSRKWRGIWLSRQSPNGHASMSAWPVARGYKCPSIYPKFQRGLYNMFQLKKVKMRKMGKRKPPYESNHTKVTCSHYVVFIPWYCHFKKQINWRLSLTNSVHQYNHNYTVNSCCPLVLFVLYHIYLFIHPWKLSLQSLSSLHKKLYNNI